MSSGIVYGGAANTTQVDVLTWHDLDERRVWVHTRQGQGSSRWLISLSIEIHQNSLPTVSEQEKKLRLKLATSQEYLGNGELTATSFREVSISELLAIHSDNIFEVLAKREKTRGRRVELSSDIRSKTSKSPSSFRFDSISEISNLGANSGDAILIAKIYTQMSLTGSRSVAKKTADALGVNVNVVHMAVRVARRNEWLTSNGAGKAGGELTPEGEKAFRQLNGPERMSALLNSDWKYTN